MSEKGKIALVTGASRGIGAAIAETLAGDGCDIWLNYRSNHDAAEKVAEKIRACGRKCRLLPFDVADAEAVEEALNPLLEQETPYILVNNAGFARDGIMALMSRYDWQSVLRVHLDGFFLITKLVVARMLRQRCGRIVNIVSTSGQIGVGGQVNYSTAKAGLIGATRSLAAEVARRKILVNAVAPGFIETEMIADLPLDKILPTIPLGRIGQTQEVADAVAFLCSDKASYITGQILSVNGGIV
ncbi:MAG: 3-oxoacyl-ACP reductase FabG [Deltaproteobacteria bacterium]|nr:3-oxoacyl-ACP reductase FabG [Deltaproteobacteria bacterium]